MARRSRRQRHGRCRSRCVDAATMPGVRASACSLLLPAGSSHNYISSRARLRRRVAPPPHVPLGAVNSARCCWCCSISSRSPLPLPSCRSPMDPKPDVAHAPAASPSADSSYPRMSPEDLATPPPPVVAPAGSNPYVMPSPSAGPPPKSTKENLMEMFGQAGKRFSEAARKTEGIAGDVWQHLKTGPSITDAAMGRIAQVSKVISEGGYDKIFQQTFECLPDEKLKKAYACYLSTSHGPIMGVLYVSTAKLAFCSDSPVAYVGEDNKTASAIYKVIVPVPHLRSVTPTASQQNPAERYIQVVSVDNHEFWFMGFVNYDSAVKYLQEAARGSA